MPMEPRGGTGVESAAAPTDPVDPIDSILAPLEAAQRGFVLGLLLQRGQAQREAIAQTLGGPSGALCRIAVRDANALPREGRLHLIRRLAGEVLGFGPSVALAAPCPPAADRLRAVLETESNEILAALEQQTSDPLGKVAESILLARGVTGTSRTRWVSDDDVRIELRRAVLGALEGDAATGVTQLEGTNRGACEPSGARG